MGIDDYITTFTLPTLKYDRDDILHWTDAVNAINKVLSQAIQNSGKVK
jgi:hypothetical protein